MKRMELVRALKAVEYAVDNKPNAFGGTNSFVFFPDLIGSYNNEMSISYPAKTDLECSIVAGDIQKVLSKMKGDEISIEIVDNTVEISDESTKLKVKMSIEDSNTRQTLESLQIQDIKWSPIPEDFMSALKICSVCMSADQSQIDGISLLGNHLYASDNYRIIRHEISKKLAKFSLPSKSVGVLMKLSGNPISYALDDNWIHFKLENELVFSIIKKSIDFPVAKIEEIIESHQEIEETFEFPDGFESALDIASTISSDEENIPISFVTIKKNKKKLIVSGERFSGSVESSVPIKTKFLEDKAIKISPIFLKAILPLTRSFSVSGNTAIFKTENITYLMTVFGG